MGDHPSGRDTPDSGIFSPDNGSRRSSMSSTDQSNGLHSRRSSTDSGLGGIMSNPSRDSNLRSKRPTADQCIQVYATGPNNKTMTLNIETSDSVDTLIQHMSKAFGLGSSQNTYLVFDGQTLNLGSGLTVEKAGIKSGSQMQLCTRVLGG